MKILEGRTGTGFTISGEAVMLSRYGDVYPVIDNKMHPNPGTEKDQYSEIERTIDWLYLHNFKAVKPLLDEWVMCRVGSLFNIDDDINDILNDVFYCDLYTPCDASIEAVENAINMYNDMSPDAPDLSIYTEEYELKVARKIVNYLNENFLRVRAGGKLNPEGADSIYFRISSHGYNWHRTIVDFLWDTFKDPKNMPKKIWIGHDAETNPPEIVLFDGTPNELFEKYDSILFEHLHVMKELRSLENYNYDRVCYILDKGFRNLCKIHNVRLENFS